MNAMIHDFLEAVGEEEQFRACRADLLQRRFVQLHATPDLEADDLTSLELTWPMESDPAETRHAIQLCRAVLGGESVYAGFATRAAAEVAQGGIYSEKIGEWKVSACNRAGTLHLLLARESLATGLERMPYGVNMPRF